MPGLLGLPAYLTQSSRPVRPRVGITLIHPRAYPVRARSVTKDMNFKWDLWKLRSSFAILLDRSFHVIELAFVAINNAGAEE